MILLNYSNVLLYLQCGIELHRKGTELYSTKQCKDI